MSIAPHERVRYWRQLRGLSQEKLAKLCGMTQFKISRIETDETNLSAEDAEAIAKGLGLTMPEFYGATGDDDAPGSAEHSKPKRSKAAS